MGKGILICIVTMIAACKGRDTASSSSTEKRSAPAPTQRSLRDATPVALIEATTLTADFRNEARGVQLYGGKVYDIHGELRRVITDDPEGPYLMVRGTDRDVSCHFEPAELPAVAQLEADMNVTIRGVITGKTTGVVVFVKPCIVAPRPPPDSERDEDELARESAERDKAELAKLTVKNVTLVDSSGKQLKDVRTGQAIAKHLGDCDALKNDEKRVECQQLFFDVQQCGADPACANKAVAVWVVKKNGDVLDTAGAVITVAAVALQGEDGKPVIGTDGKPVIKKLAACSSLTGTQPDTCEELFINVSNCAIDPPPEGVSACAGERMADWMLENPEAAKN